MRIAMYQGPPADFWHKVGHWVTCVVTASKYSHCELVFSDGMCGSSSARDGGVRLKKIDFDSGRWDMYQIPEGYSEAAAREWFAKNLGKPYDWLGLLWFLLPIKAFNNPSRYFAARPMLVR